MARVNYIDTTLRDGHQCLWATRMTTAMMDPVIETLDAAGFEAIELMGAVHFDACIRYLNEDPWARIRLVRSRTSTPLQALLRSRCALGFELAPKDVNRLWVERLIANGINRFVAFDGLHDLDNLEDSLLHAKRLGATTTGWLIFSESPVHTDELYAAKAREFIERAEVDALMIEDTGGILTPERTRTLLPTIEAVAGGKPLGIHTHNLVGLGQLVYIAAVECGIDNLYTCIPPVADGNAPPSVLTTLRNLRYLGHEDDLDEAALIGLSEHFERMALMYDKPLGKPADFDASNFGHQIPGGVLSNLVAQLGAAGLGDKVKDVLTECARVREELGYPIMVTPFSQLVGVQATLNILEGDRYSRVPDEVKKYAMGHYGKLLAPVEADVLDRIMTNGSPTVGDIPPHDLPVLEPLRAQYPDADEDQLMIRTAFAPHLIDGPPPAAPPPRVDVGGLVNELLKQDPGLGEVRINTGDGVDVTVRW